MEILSNSTIVAKNVLLFTGNTKFVIARHWEDNEKLFVHIKKHLINSGVHEHLSYFEYLENCIRWKGKEDSAKYSGKSMLRKWRDYG